MSISTLSPRKLSLLAAAGIMAVAITFFLVYGTAFGRPVAHELPILVVGDDALAAQLDGTPQFSVEQVATLDDARTELRDRQAYGAIAVAPDGSLDVLLASGMGRSGISQVTGAATALAAQGGTTAQIEDVVPLATDNPAGSFEFYVVVFLGLVGGAGASVLARVLGAPSGRSGFVRRVGFLAGYTAVAAGLFTFLVAVVLDTLPSHGVALFAVLWAYAFATALALSGVQALLGSAAAIGASLLLTMFGNASSGGPVVREALPRFYDALHPLLPHGAAIDLIRGVEYFGGTGVATAITTLIVWAVAGLVAMRAASWRTKRLEPATSADELELEVAMLVEPALPAV